MDVVETINTYGIVQLFYKVVTNNHWTSQSSSPLFGQYAPESRKLNYLHILGYRDNN